MSLNPPQDYRKTEFTHRVGLSSDRPSASDVLVGTLYFSTDTSVLERSDGSVWSTYSGSGGGSSLHAATHSDGGTDEVDVTNLGGYPGGGTTFLRDDGVFASAGSGGAHATTHEPGGSDAMAVDAIAATGSLRTLGIGSQQATAGNDARLTNARTPTAHASSHSFAASDPITITNLTGFPGGTTTFLRADATFAAPSSSAVTRQITVIIDGGGATITTGLKTFLSLPLAGTWQKWRLLSIDASATTGSIVMDVWKDTYTNYPPALADSITASAKPTLSSVNKNESSTLTGWTTTFSAGDVLAFNVDSITTLTKVMLVLEFQ